MHNESQFEVIQGSVPLFLPTPTMQDINNCNL